jgi:hypothetical protein
MPTPTAIPTPVGLVLRGEIDASGIEAGGLIASDHRVELVTVPEGGPVTGLFTIVFEEFPIGSILTQTFGGGDDPAYAAFKTCTVRMTLLGLVSGDFDNATGKLSGEAAFTSSPEDVRDCLKTRPANITMDPSSMSPPTTVPWNATLDGSEVTGVVSLKPQLPFTATRTD